MKGLIRLGIMLLLYTPLFATSQILRSSDVKKVMEELFDYHVDKKEISPLLLERSLKIYVTEFDTRHAYLLASEVGPFIKPQGSFLNAVLAEYQNERFSAYFALNETIEQGIMRARSWRAEWERDPLALIAAASQVPLQREDEDERFFLHDEQELKNRHYEEFLKLVRCQIEEIEEERLKGREYKVIALCEKQLSLAENQYLGLDDENCVLAPKKKEHQVFLRVLKALSHSLDAHTAYYSPEEAHAMKVQLEKGMCGIGVVLHESVEGVIVADMIKGGPAEKTGELKVGDHIVEIDGAAIEEYSFRKVLEVLRGDEGSKTTLGIKRIQKEREPEYFSIELTRSHMVIDDKRVDVSYEPHGDGIIGKITLYSFYEGEDGVNSEKDLRKAIEYLQAQGPLLGLVLDMRENSGGFLSQAVRVSGLFISGGVVVISKYSDGSVKYYRTVEGRRFYEGPLVVLVSKGSASATEIVAQTLQDYGVALVVGDEQTYGKGTIQHQTVTSESTSSFFKVTIGRYYTVSGKSTQIEGVKADILVPTALNFEKLGEAALEFPLPSDQIAGAYEDTLADLDPYARKWFAKYYLPTLQKRVDEWSVMVPHLQENSTKRLVGNKNFQLFLKKSKKEVEEGERVDFGSNDLQMDESVNIIKDMIYLKQVAA